MSNTNSPRRPKSIFGKTVTSSPSRTESEHSSGKIQATGTMREAFPPSLPGSPILEKTQPRQLTGQPSVQQLDAPRTNTISGTSPKKDNSATDSLTTAATVQLQKSKKTTTKLGHSPHHHRNSSPNTKFTGYCSGSPTLKSDLKTHPERGMYNHIEPFTFSSDRTFGLRFFDFSQVVFNKFYENHYLRAMKLFPLGTAF